MKIKNLKFNQLTSLINNGKFKLDLFDDKDQLFDQDNQQGNKTTRNIDRFNLKNNYAFPRPQTGQITQRSKFIRLSSRRTTVNRSLEEQDNHHYMAKCLISYINYISSEQRKSIKRQLQTLLSLLYKQSPRDIFEQLMLLQPRLSKKFKNRLIHLVFYLLLNSLLRFSPSRTVSTQIKNYILCQYYSRKFNFKQLAMTICIQIQQMYCLINSYEESRAYARKSLKLAVVLNNEYFETKMIEALHILNYYEGRLNQCKDKLLSKEQRKRILQNYNEETETPNLFNEVRPKVEDRFDYKEFNLEHHNNFIQNSIPNENIKYFQTNYHQIIKGIPGKNINVRNIIKKVASVGVVRKYFAKDNFITIKPQCHALNPMYQEQVLISHKKQNSSPQQQQQNLCKILKRIRGSLEQIIDAYTYRL